jgi:RNA polymerase sigma-70 factor (ECF subfamily)
MSTSEMNHQISNLHPILRAFTRKFTSDRDESLDLIQDTILRALTYKHKFRENTNLKGWLFTIMRNTFINNYRKNKRARISRDHTKELYYLNVEDTHTFHGPATNFEYNDIWNHVNSLRDELLVPFKMHTSGYKYHEIAEHQNIPIGTVKNRIFHARNEIQKKLAGY